MQDFMDYIYIDQLLKVGCEYFGVKQIYKQLMCKMFANDLFYR